MHVLLLRVLVLSILLIGMGSFLGRAEPMMLAMVGSRANVAETDGIESVVSYEEQRNAITLIRVGPRVGESGKSPFGKD
jgi:hypothetical protein